MDKATRRLAKAIKRGQVAEAYDGIDVACVIHGDLYSWLYVEHLRDMVCTNISVPVNFHVFTEPQRSVPSPMIKHSLELWPNVEGRKKAWWYKMQMFDPTHIARQVLYFDLDVVITSNIDWVLSMRRDYFWALRDFKYLWRPNWHGINSSMMWWNVPAWERIWKDFRSRVLARVMRQFPGDQDFLSSVIDARELRFIDQNRVASWRWQVWEGGMDMHTRQTLCPGQGMILPPENSVVIFHGNPKPHEIDDDSVKKLWGTHK